MSAPTLSGPRIDGASPVQELLLSPWIINALVLSEVHTVQDLLDSGSERLLLLPGIGRRAVDEIERRLAIHGFELPATRS